MSNSLPDQITVIVEGSYILSKVLDDPSLLVRQLKHFRRYLELLLLPHLSGEAKAEQTS